MIKDPRPCYWMPPDQKTINNMVDPSCKYSKRYLMLCGQSRAKCKLCSVRQMNLTDFVLRYSLPEDEDPSDFQHVCDRCGREITVQNSLIYVGLQNRKGGVLIPDMELCFSCGAELAEWLKGGDFFVQDGGVESPSDALWGENMPDAREDEE